MAVFLFAEEIHSRSKKKYVVPLDYSLYFILIV